MTKFSLCSLALLTGLGCTVAACSSDDDTSSPGGSAGNAPVGQAGAGEGGASGAGEGGAAGEGSALYLRLGGHAGITKDISAIVTAELGDDDIASFFAPNLGGSHMPQAGDIEECLVAQLGNASGGHEAYPTVTSSGFMCRSMPEAHKDLHIGSDTFDTFVTIAGGVLKGHISDADLATVASVLTNTKGDIVDPNAPASGPCISKACEVNEAGAGGTGGSN